MVDTTAQVAAVRRGVRTTTEEGRDVRVQTLTREYPSALQDVWEAVTTPDRIARWFGPITAEARVGGRYQVEGNAGGEVLECAPPAAGEARYRLTWEYGGGVTWLEIDLASVGDDETRFTLTHTGRVEDVPPGFWEQFGPGATGVGWDMGLLGLALHLSEPSASVGAHNAEEWQVGPEGQAFSRSAADAWARAHVEDGGDPADAARAADATYAFYTGQEPPATA